MFFLNKTPACWAKQHTWFPVQQYYKQAATPLWKKVVNLDNVCLVVATVFLLSRCFKVRLCKLNRGRVERVLPPKLRLVGHSPSGEWSSPGRPSGCCTHGPLRFVPPLHAQYHGSLSCCTPVLTSIPSSGSLSGATTIPMSPLLLCS